MAMNETYDGGKLAEDLRALVNDAEALLRATAKAGNGELQQRAQATLQDLRARYNAIASQLGDRAHDVDAYVHQNPWQAVAAVGGLGLLVGVLMGLARR
jgi:ElaB/YqjD/DUF883 family membrane-anchored ribosome-binding protein